MKVAKLEDMVKGWFVGNFDPTLIKTNEIGRASCRERVSSPV